jgi:hypothetical protein
MIKSLDRRKRSSRLASSPSHTAEASFGESKTTGVGNRRKSGACGVTTQLGVEFDEGLPALPQNHPPNSGFLSTSRAEFGFEVNSAATKRTISTGGNRGNGMGNESQMSLCSLCFLPFKN